MGVPRIRSRHSAVFRVSASPHARRRILRAVDRGDGFPLDNCGVMALAGKFVEESAIVNHGTAQIFSARLSLGLTKRYFVSGAIVLGYDRMVDRDVRSSLLKVAHRITAGCHQVADQLVGFRNCAGRSINKVSLYAIPL